MMTIDKLSLNKRFRFEVEWQQKKNVIYVKTGLRTCKCVEATGSYTSMIGNTYDVTDLHVLLLNDDVVYSSVETNVISKYRF